MGSYRDEYYSSVDALFGNIKPSPFDNPIADPTPQEQAKQIGPVGWVANADGTDGTAKVTIDGDGLTVLDGKVTVKDIAGIVVIDGGVVQAAGIEAGSVTTDKFATTAQAPGVSNSTGQVVIDSSGITVINGAITIKNAGGDVIIDGSSVIFHILTSGTCSLTQAAGTAGISDNDLPGLGTWSTIPVALTLVSFLNATVGNTRQIGREIGFLPEYAASSSGGSPTSKFQAIEYEASAGSDVRSASNYASIRLGLTNYSGVSRTVYCKYHLLAEAAL